MKKLVFRFRDAVALIAFAAFFFVILWLRYNWFPALIDISAYAFMVF